MENEKRGKDVNIFSLVFWVGFLIVAVLFARFSGGSNISTNSNIPQKSLLDNYEFIYSNDDGNIYGRAYGGKYLFVFKDLEYYYNGEKLYLVLNHSLKEVSSDIGIIKITPSMIDSLIDEKDQVKINKNYYVSLYKFMNVYDNDVPVDGSEASKYNIVIDKYFKDGSLYMVKLDLSNYYLLKGIQNTGIITIDLYNQGSVSDFSKEYDGLGVVE